MGGKFLIQPEATTPRSDMTTRHYAVAILLSLGATHAAFAQSAPAATQARGDIAAQLREVGQSLASPLDPPQTGDASRAPRSISQDLRTRLDEANLRSSREWREIKTRDDWEAYRQRKLAALRQSLGAPQSPPDDLHVRVTRTLAGDGHKIENLVFESRPGLLVTANLYSPDPPRDSMPGILICHSHHAPKTQGELQDMGMLWARAGCLVLVMDQLGHGERRQHPFVTAADYPKEFRVSRQDYYFRYNTAMQLHLSGESLMGWMAWDLMRGVDLLAARPGIDPRRIVLLGAVAGGGDPCSVAAALDARIAAAVPFNFGGPQPETRFPLPENAEDAFNYAGGGSWESTRNLRLSAREGFLPWVIVGSVAPRRLVYAHEFAWDRQRDPVWRRLEQIYGWYAMPDRLAFTLGRGSVTGQAPESTHCTNIGAEHRRLIYDAFERWFGIPKPEKETQTRRPAEELLCLPAARDASMRPLWQLTSEIASQRLAQARRELSTMDRDARRQAVRSRWAELLGEVSVPVLARQTEASSDVTDRFPRSISAKLTWLETADGAAVGLLRLSSRDEKKGKPPIVVAVAQGGIRDSLSFRSDAIAAILAEGIEVWLPDVRAGSTAVTGGRGRQSSATSLSATGQMVGQTVLAARLQDLRLVLSQVRPEDNVLLWGVTSSPRNPADALLAAPLDAPDLPKQAEPMGSLLALFASLYDEQKVDAVALDGGLASFQSVLESPFIYLPHDSAVPGALTVGDLCDVAAELAPRPLRLQSLVDGRNRPVSLESLQRAYAPALSEYRAAGASERLELAAEADAAATISWIIARCQAP
jgi:dienelactone hydrolase